MSNSIVAQVPKNLLFQYRVACKRFPGKPGGKIELTEADINKLEGAWHNSYAQNHSDGGFFYGHQFQDESVKHYREDDLAFIEAAKSAIKEGKQIVYSCWW